MLLLNGVCALIRKTDAYNELIKTMSRLCSEQLRKRDTELDERRLVDATYICNDMNRKKRVQHRTLP